MTDTVLLPSELKRQARFALRETYGEAVAVILIRVCIVIPATVLAAVLLMRGASISDAVYFTILIGSELALLALLSGALAVGAARYFLDTAALRGPEVPVIFKGFRDYRGTVEMFLLKTALTLLWSLLLLVPGVIAALRYAMAPYLMAVSPGTKATEALRLSKELMKGRKRAYFRLLLSFAGWYLPGLATAGLGFFFIAPYVETAKAAFFNACLEQQGAAVGVETDPA